MSKSLAAEIKLLSKHSSIYGLSNVLNRIVSFILLPLYLHYLTPSDYAIKELLVYTIAFVEIVLDLGINAAMGRFYFDSDDQKDRNVVVSTALYGFGIGSTVLILLTLIGSRSLTELIFKESEYTHLMVLSLLGLGVDMYIKVAYNYMRVRHRSLTLTIVSVVRLGMQLGLNILFIVGYGMGVEGILWSTLISNIVLVAFLMPYVIRETGFRYSWPKLKEMIHFGLPLIPSSFMSYIVNVSDRFFVNSMHGLQMTGLYTLGYRFGVLINEFVSAPFAQIWTPRRFEMYEKDEAEKIFAQIFTYFCLAMFFVGLGISVTIKDVIQFISEKEYWEAWKVVPPLTFTYIIASFTMHLNVGIMMKKKTSYVMYINISTAILNLALNYFLIKNWGMWGAVWATLISFVVKDIITYFASNRLVKVVVEWSRLFKSTIVAVLLYWPINMIDTGYPLANVAIKSVACLSYPLILYVIGFYEPDEIRRGWEFARPYVGKVIPRFRDSGPNPPAA